MEPMTFSRGVRVLLLAATLALAAAAPELLSQSNPSTPFAPGQPGTSSFISQSGLLPLFAVDMRMDPSWVDGTSAPSKSAEFSQFGVNATFQQVWDALKPAGLNMIRFPVDLGDQHSATRLANLCLWAKANNVSLIPVLKGTSAGDKDKTLLAVAASKFIAHVVSLLRAGDAQQFAAYTQISYYQLEDTLNHTGLHPQLSREAAQEMLLNAAGSVRKAELQALRGTGAQATPVLISASFDYELIRQGAIAGVPLDAAAEQKAQSALLEFLAPVVASPNVDAVNVEWFPRSVSAGDVDHFPTLLGALEGAFPDKQLSLTTGFSSAFNTPDQQLPFYTVTFTTLTNFRAANGANSHFIGAVFREAFNGPGADTKAPVSGSDPSQWNWGEKAQQLSRMWPQGSTSADLSWWLNKVQDNMGLLSLQPNGAGGVTVVPLPAEQAFQQISTAVAQVSQGVGQQGTTPTVQSSSQANSAQPLAESAGATGAMQPTGTSQSQRSLYQELLFTLVQQVTTQLTNALAPKLAGTPGQGVASLPNSNGAPYTAAANPGAAPATTGLVASPVSLAPQDVTVDPTNTAIGQAVRITAQLHNGSTDQDVTGLTVLVVDPSSANSGNQARQDGIMVPRAGTTPVQLSWRAGQASTGQAQLTLQVLDAGGAQVANVQVPTITVAGSSAGGNPGSASSDKTGGAPQGASNSFVGGATSSAGSIPVRPGIPTTFVIGRVASTTLTPGNTRSTTSAPHGPPGSGPLAPPRVITVKPGQSVGASTKSSSAASPRVITVKPGQRIDAGTKPVTSSSGTTGSAATVTKPRTVGGTSAGALPSAAGARSVVTIKPQGTLPRGIAHGGASAPVTPNSAGSSRPVVTVAPQSSASRPAGVSAAPPASATGGVGNAAPQTSPYAGRTQVPAPSRPASATAYPQSTKKPATKASPTALPAQQKAATKKTPDSKASPPAKKPESPL